MPKSMLSYPLHGYGLKLILRLLDDSSILVDTGNTFDTNFKYMPSAVVSHEGQGHRLNDKGQIV